MSNELCPTELGPTELGPTERCPTELGSTELAPDELSVELPVRLDDVDVNGHVRGGAYLCFADHARWALTHAAGVDLAAFTAHGLGPVNLETTVRFISELRPHDTVRVWTRFEHGSGKTGRVTQRLLRGDQLVAEVTSVTGMLDLATRRLVADPAARLRAMAARPELLGLA